MTPIKALKAILSLLGNVDHASGNGPNAAKLRGDMLNDIRLIAVQGIAPIKSDLRETKDYFRRLKLLINIGHPDFKLLRTQKLHLLQTISDLEAKVKPGQLDARSRRARRHYYSLSGILNLIDKIQDEAVNAGVPERFVFPKNACSK